MFCGLKSDSSSTVAVVLCATSCQYMCYNRFQWGFVKVIHHVHIACMHTVESHSLSEYQFIPECMVMNLWESGHLKRGSEWCWTLHSTLMLSFGSCLCAMPFCCTFCLMCCTGALILASQCPLLCADVGCDKLASIPAAWLGIICMELWWVAV